MTLPPFSEHFSVLAPDYDLLLCDIWGVVHNGVTAYPQACEALQRFRADGGCVVLITNAPRPSPVVEAQLRTYSVPRDAYDAVVSSGDVTREVIKSRPGQSIFHLGPERDAAIFDGLGVAFADAEHADYVVCSGLFHDETETPDDYRATLQTMRRRGLFMLCANPDVIVHRGDQVVYCAGALADRYRDIGGEVLYAGKPHKPIYEIAVAKAPAEKRARVLAIGDSVRTDLTGAHAYGVDFLFLTAGIHSEELGDNPSAEAIAGLLGQEAPPRAIMRRLAW